jgi:phosphoribosylformylglycinamidine (FGAM) synthase-like enzyme
MAARCGSELVKSPGTLVMTLYVQCPDIRLTVTPDLKLNTAKSLGKLLYVDLGAGRARLGGTALAQVFNQVYTIHTTATTHFQALLLIVLLLVATSIIVVMALWITGYAVNYQQASS